MVLFCFFFFFFFQAEDGIRDGTVTGVQTCALPILMIPNSVAAFVAASAPARAMATPPLACTLSMKTPRRVASRTAPATRSEERRVGKEGRSRWLPDP